MRDVEAVLCEKAKQADQVRREIRALRLIIPLLMEDEHTPEDAAHLLSGHRAVEQSPDHGMADLKTYYGFARHMRTRQPT